MLSAEASLQSRIRRWQSPTNKRHWQMCREQATHAGAYTTVCAWGWRQEQKRPQASCLSTRGRLHKQHRAQPEDMSTAVEKNKGQFYKAGQTALLTHGGAAGHQSLARPGTGCSKQAADSQVLSREQFSPGRVNDHEGAQGRMGYLRQCRQFYVTAAGSRQGCGKGRGQCRADTRGHGTGTQGGYGGKESGRGAG